MKRWHVGLAALVLLLGVSSSVQAATQTITFDALPPNTALNGQYPASTVDWGNNAWLVSGPWGSFSGNSISFANGTITSGTFTPLRQQIPISVDAFNGGTTPTTLTR